MDKLDYRPEIDDEEDDEDDPEIDPGQEDCPEVLSELDQEVRKAQENIDSNIYYKHLYLFRFQYVLHHHQCPSYRSEETFWRNQVPSPAKPWNRIS